MTNKNKIIEEFVEKGAALEHDRWSKWQQYLFDQCIPKNGSITIPPFFVAHWGRQIATKYSELSEKEKESDRKETRSYIPLLEKALSDQRREIQKMIGEMEGVAYTPDGVLIKRTDILKKIDEL